MSLPRVSVIVVSYQVRELLRRCLQSLNSQQGVELEVFVVDNLSRDGSAEMVAREFPAVHLIRNTENVGFSRANNQALAVATGEYFTLLNPDTESPPDTLATLVAVFARHPRAGAVGLALVNPDGSHQPSCFAFPTVGNLLIETLGLHGLGLRFGIGTPSAAPPPAGAEGVVEWVSGACIALRRTAYARVGGLDEAIFMYGEELAWCWRARALGFETVYSNAARVLHHGGASGVDARGELFVRNIEGRLSFLRQRGPLHALLGREVMTLGAGLRFAYWRIRAALGARGTRVDEQLERFGAVLRWRWRGGR